MRQSPSTRPARVVRSAGSSRREFFKRAAAAGAVFAVPQIVTTPVFGAAAAEQPRQRRPDRLRQHLATITSATWPQCPTCGSSPWPTPTRAAARPRPPGLNQQYGAKRHRQGVRRFSRDPGPARRGRRDRRRPRQLAHADVGRGGQGRQGRLLPEAAGAGFRPRAVAPRSVIRRKEADLPVRNAVPFHGAGTGRWSNWCATATSANSSGSTFGAATCRSTWTSMHVKPYGSAAEIPVPAGPRLRRLDGAFADGPVHRGSGHLLGRIPLSRDLAGLHRRLRHPRVGTRPMGQQEPIIPARSATRAPASVPTEGIFRTLERWDVTCDYANGVKLRFMDFRTAKPVAAQYLPSWHDGDGVIFHGTEGWISDAEGFCASNKSLWKVKFKPGDEQLAGLAGTQPELHRLRQVAPGDDLPGGNGDPLRHDLPDGEHRGPDGAGDPMGPRKRGDRRRRGGVAKMLVRPFREKWKVW